MENLSMGSGSTKSKENIHRFDKRSLKDKLRHKFTSPALSRKEFSAVMRNEAKSESLFSEGNSRCVKDMTSSPNNICSLESTLPNSPFRGASGSDAKTTLPKPAEIIHAPQTDQGLGVSAEQDKSVASDNTTEGGNLSFEDSRSERSFESTLIDPELMAKLTKIQSSPSATASEDSSASLAEATVSDNESFTLGSSGSNSGIANTNDILVAQMEHSNKEETETDVTRMSSESQATIINPIVAIMTESCPGNLDGDSIVKHEDSVSLGESKSESIDVSQRPSSLSSEAEGLLNVGVRGTSPETPQGDSTFLDIQYHPLSDTTEPSTPSESHFGNGTADASTPIAASMPSFPKRGTPLSPDLSSSSADDPIENFPIYENVETNSESYSSFINQCEDGENNYENVLYQSSGGTPKTGDEQNIHVTNTIIRKKSLPKKGKNLKCETAVSVDKIDIIVPDTEYENVRSPGSIKTGLLETALDDYEPYNFESQPEYENVTVRNLQANVPPSNHEEQELSIDIDGEIVYQQVKYLRRSIQEVNDLLGTNDRADIPTTREHPNNTSVGSLLPTGSTKSVIGSAKCPSPHKVLESATADDAECLESPMTPSSSSLPTEVLVFPSFSSPTESTTDDVTSSDASETVSASGTSFRRSPTFVPRFSPQTVASFVDESPVNGSARSDRNHSNAEEFSSSLEVISHSPRTENNSSVSSHPTVLPHLSIGSSTRSSESSSPQSNPASSQITSASSGTASISSCSPDLTPIGENYDLPLVQVPVPSAPCTSFENYTGTTTASLKDSDFATDDILSMSSNRKNIEPCQPLLAEAVMDSITTAAHASGRYESSQNESDCVLTNLNPEMEVENLVREETDEPAFVEKKTSTLPEMENMSKHPIITQALQRHKTAPDIPKPQILVDNTGHQSKEAEDVPVKAKSDPGQSTEITSALIVQEDETTKRERIEKYKEERRMFLREKFKSESFRGEKDEMLLRLKQKATSPSRADDEVFLIDDCSNDTIMPTDHNLHSSSQERIDIDRAVEETNLLKSHEGPSVTETISLLSQTRGNQTRSTQEKNCPRSSSTSQLSEKIKQITSPNRHSSPNPPTSSASKSVTNESSVNTSIKSPSAVSSSFVRSSNTRNSGGRKKNAALVADIDDISVRDRAAVWGKESTSQKMPSDNTSASRAKYETGLYFGGQPNKEPGSDKLHRFTRGISHDPTTSRAPVDLAPSHGRVTRVVSCTSPVSETATVSKPSKLIQSEIFSGRNGNGTVKKTQCTALSPGSKTVIERIEKNSSSVANNGKILGSSDRSEPLSMSKTTDLMSSKTPRANVVTAPTASSTRSSTCPVSSRLPQSSSAASNSRASSLAVSNKGTPSATLSKPSAVSQQQRKIRDMAAMFEGPGSSSLPASAGPSAKIMRQSSREGN
ncbi:hypothetical protein FHG87_022562 [Trinorchestia longiramus]|nr:hypothetical protein FHG87_022562 [Trinorchestia longiramus]